MPFLVGHKRYSELVRKLLSATGGDVGVEIDALLKIAAVFSLDRPEHAFLSDEYLTVGTKLSGNTAALFTGIGIQNPAGSGIQIVVEGAAVSPATNIAHTWFKNVTDAEVSGFTMTTRDQRLEGISVAKTPTGRLQEFRSVAFGGGGVRVWPGPVVVDPNSRKNDGPFPWILDPGKNLVAYLVTANNIMEAGFIARERPLERYEARR
jgi:hypothetical protein